MLKRLNGWRRLWLVLAGLGMLYGIWFALHDAAKHYALEGGVLLGFARPQCTAIIQMPAGTKLNPGPRLDSPCWDLYLYRSIYEDARDTKDGYIQHRNSLQRSRIFDNLLFVGIIWVVSSLLLYGVGVVVAWVIQGFKRPA